jgi:hypothetical protein
MTPKEKALDLIGRYVSTGYGWYLNDQKDVMTMPQIKECALITVDEVIRFGNESGVREPMIFWQKVKQEIENYNQFTK